jgi:cell division protein FtsI (penicillin-binding protein 3)
LSRKRNTRPANRRSHSERTGKRRDARDSSSGRRNRSADGRREGNPAPRTVAARRRKASSGTSLRAGDSGRHQQGRGKPGGSGSVRGSSVRGRVRVVVIVLALAAVFPIWKLLGVIVGGGAALAEDGRSQGLSEVAVPALRGSIVDRTGAEMAMSLPRVRIAANARDLGRLAEEDPTAEGRFVAALAESTDATEEELIEALDASAPDDPWVKLVDLATPAQAEAAKEAMTAEGVLPALLLEDTSVRVHPAEESGLRIVGTLGPDGPGPGAGVERVLDEELTGSPGTLVVERSPSGDVIAGSEEMVSEPTAGATVRLTIDRNLQYEVERVLMRGAEKAGANGGIAVVGRPSTGELLAVAGVERDPETGQLGLARSAKAFSEAHQAGSVFKLVPVSAAIEQGEVDIDTVLNVPPEIQLYDRTFSDNDPHPTTAMSVRDIVARSSNVGTIKIAQEVGAERLHSALADFGFGSRSGIANPAESAGLLPDPQDWIGPDIAASAIGTLQSATAVQLWAAYNVIANDGTYVSPRLVESVERADGTVLDGSEVEGAGGNATRRVVSAETAAQVQDALNAVITEGTGRSWAIPGFPAAAKTGTSRMPSPERADSEDGYIWPDGRYHYLNAFTGYLPLDDPQLSITVLLEDVDSGLTGSSGAGPVFSELARLGIRELGIAPQDSSAGATGLRAAPAAAPSTTVPSTTLPSGAGRAAEGADEAPDTLAAHDAEGTETDGGVAGEPAGRTSEGDGTEGAPTGAASTVREGGPPDG